jgi:hypothetical protein
VPGLQNAQKNSVSPSARPLVEVQTELKFNETHSYSHNRLPELDISLVERVRECIALFGLHRMIFHDAVNGVPLVIVQSFSKPRSGSEKLAFDPFQIIGGAAAKSSRSLCR